MLTSIRLRNFKSFADAEAPLGPLTLLVGANASGKSNLLDALRFLKGLASEKMPLDRLLQGQAGGRGASWPGIRGGIHEVVRSGASSFAMEATYQGHSGDVLVYAIECGVTPSPFLMKESLRRQGSDEFVFGLPKELFPPLRGSMLQALEAFLGVDMPDIKALEEVWKGLSALTFLDMTPPLMRGYVPQEMAEIGETGENLSAVLYQLCKDPEQKQSLVDWLAELCAPELEDIDFSITEEGEVMARLIEKDKIRVSARSLSDGTLRFLGELVALRTAPEGSILLMEEVGNGLHPRRIHLLVEYLETITEERNIQVIATTHSPLVLQALGPRARGDAVLFSRAPDKPGTILRRFSDLPGFAEIAPRRGMDYLFTTGWLEQAL